MSNLRAIVKLTLVLLAVWLSLVCVKALPRPIFLSSQMDIELLAYVSGIFAVSLLLFWKTPASTSFLVKTSTDKPDESAITKLIANLEKKYKKREGDKLAGRFPVNLRIVTSGIGTSEKNEASFITLQDKEVSREIGEVFDRAHGRLLVVGLPGAGKTTLLLQLALDLLSRIEKTKNEACLAGIPHFNPAIPVLLNLATWRTEFGNFEDWLRRVLPNELGVSKAFAEKTYANTSLILLLDGLDEVPEADRKSCLTAIGEYGSKPAHQYAISCRRDEIKSLENHIPKNLYHPPVEVAPLTAVQIEMNLLATASLQPEAKPLLYAIQRDPLLKQAVENPFHLNTAQLLFASGKSWSEFGFIATDVIGRQQELVQRFVEYALARKVKRDYPTDKAKKWLRFLAGKMEEEGLRELELGNLQPSWAIDSRLYGVFFMWLAILYLALAGIMLSFVFNIGMDIYHENWIPVFQFLPILFVVLILTALVTFFMIIIVFCIGGLLSEIFKIDSIGKLNKINVFSKRFMYSKITRNYTHSWSWKKYWRYWKETWKITTIGCGGVIFLISMTGLIVNMVSGVMNFTGVVQYAIFLITVFLFSAFAGAIMSFLSADGREKDVIQSLRYPEDMFSNEMIITHPAIRMTLALEGSIPICLVRFLNEMSRRHLLEFDGDVDTGRGGGAWRWRHRIVQEYFLREK